MDRPAFTSDYMEGAHPLILEQLAATNLVKSSGYGTDEFCESARRRIREACAVPEAAVYFLAGGTQTNAAVIGALLMSYQGVISAATGHINGHEAGAVEFGGHKILALPHENGKLTAGTAGDFCAAYYADGNRDHIVMPGMIYISQPTEYGTLYTLDELEALKVVCRKYGLKLYVDGARLAYALACPENDVSLTDLARLCDAFYIGGTKCGALFGEALVIPDPDLLPHFFTIMKQQGALLAKGRILGIQFDVLFTDGLYSRIGLPAILAADRMRRLFVKAGWDLFIDSPTNQVFVELDDEIMERLSEEVEFCFWEKRGPGRTAVRFAASWAVTEEDIDRLEEAVERCLMADAAE